MSKPVPAHNGEKEDFEDALAASRAQHFENSADSRAAVEPIPTEELPDRLAEAVSYGPGGMRGLVSSPFVFGAAFLASLGGYSFGYDQGVISIINVMPQFHEAIPETANGGFYTGFMTAMLEFGAFLGCFFMPWLADKISRKWALSVVVVIFNIGAIIQTAAPNYGALVAGRTIGGVGVGTLALGAPLYISEIAPPQLRGALLVLESISIVTGVVTAYWITYGTQYLEGEIAFRLPFGLQMVCATLLGFGIHFFPFSPRWLALVGRDEDTLQSLSKLRRLPDDDERVQIEWRGILAEVEFQKIVLDKRHPGVRGFKLEQFSGINGFIYYAPILFRSIGQSDEMSLVLSGILNIVQLIAVIICFFIIDAVGRRPLAVWGGFGMGFPYVIMAALVGIYGPDWENTAAGWATTAMAFIYILIYGVSYSPLGWALPPEVFPNSSRAKGVALSTATVWLCNFIVGVIVPIMIEDAGWGTYLFFAIMCFLSGTWAYFLVPETMGKTLEEMDEVFHDSSAHEEKELMRAAAGNARRSSNARRESMSRGMSKV